MTRVLVVYGSRHGATRGIAERILEVLRTEGIGGEAADANDLRADLPPADAYVIGSGVYMGSWLREAIGVIERNEAMLATRPLWLFSSGPLLGSTPKTSGGGPLEDALGPADGPGSGGRKKIEELSAITHPLDHRVFTGAFDPDDPPRTVGERLVRMMPTSKGLLPPGDFRDWVAIEAWAREIAARLVPMPVPA
jgi:menaquinone-dependent protoporphyrinogen oxidase